MYRVGGRERHVERKERKSYVLIKSQFNSVFNFMDRMFALHRKKSFNVFFIY